MLFIFTQFESPKYLQYRKSKIEPADEYHLINKLLKPDVVVVQSEASVVWICIYKDIEMDGRKAYMLSVFNDFN